MCQPCIDKGWRVDLNAMLDAWRVDGKHGKNIYVNESRKIVDRNDLLKVKRVKENK